MVLTEVSIVPEVLALPVVTFESPPVFFEAELLPVFVVWFRLLPTVAELFCLVVVVALVPKFAELVLSDPFAEFPTVADGV